MPTSERQIALVSGGSRGIGRAAVLELARRGFDVAFCYRSDSDASRAVEKEVADAGSRAVATQVDVADADAVRAWVTATERDLGPIAVAVTSAGIVRDRPLVMMGDDDWRTVLDVNLTGTYNVCRAVAFPMMKRKAGCVVTVSSIAGVAGHATQANYSASKAGIIGLTKALAKEVGRYGIRANVVAPGFVETDMLAGLSGDRLDQAVASIPLGRLGRPDDVAGAIAYLVGASYVTGVVLQVDGGIVI